MSPRSKKEYIAAINLRYKNASRKQKTPILNEFCATLGFHRKHAIRLLRKFKRFRKTKTKKPGRAPFYSQTSILKPLKKIWLAANLPCSKRLKTILPPWIPGYIQSFGPLPPEILEALSRISPATIDRILSPTRIHLQKKRPLDYQTRNPTPKPNPHPNQPMERIPPRLPRSRHRRPRR
jgi:hypothetical protein